MKPRDYHREIADERDRLRAENEKLRLALRAFCVDAEHDVVDQETLKEARAILKETKRDQ